MKKILLIVLIAFTLTVCVAPVQSVEERCFDFANEKVKDLKCPKDTIQGIIFQDLKPNCSGLHITPVLHNIKQVNHFFIGSGKVKIDPGKVMNTISEYSGKKVNLIAVIVWAKHFFGGKPQPLVKAYDSKNLWLDSDQGPAVQNKLQKVVVYSPGISYIVIEGVEVAILKICFVYTLEND